MPGKLTEMRKRVFDLLVSENGIRTIDIAQRLGINTNQAGGHLQELSRDGKIYAERHKVGHGHSWFANKEIKASSLWRIQPGDGRVRYY